MFFVDLGLVNRKAGGFELSFKVFRDVCSLRRLDVPATTRGHCAPPVTEAGLTVSPTQTNLLVTWEKVTSHT